MASSCQSNSSPETIDLTLSDDETPPPQPPAKRQCRRVLPSVPGLYTAPAQPLATRPQHRAPRSTPGPDIEVIDPVANQTYDLEFAKDWYAWTGHPPAVYPQSELMKTLANAKEWKREVDRKAKREAEAQAAHEAACAESDRVYAEEVAREREEKARKKSEKEAEEEAEREERPIPMYYREMYERPQTFRVTDANVLETGFGVAEAFRNSSNAHKMEVTVRKQIIGIMGQGHYFVEYIHAESCIVGKMGVRERYCTCSK